MFGEPLPGQERPPECFFEIISGLEIVPAVLLGFRKQRVLHHIEDQFTDVLATADAPLGEYGLGHGTVLGQSVLSRAIEELLAADMPGRFLFQWFRRGPGDDFLLMIERLADEEISFTRIPRILGDNLFKLFVEIDSVHRG